MTITPRQNIELEFSCRVDFHIVMLTVNKRIFDLIDIDITTACYSLQAIMNTSTVFAVIAKHNVSMSSVTVHITIWNPIKGKTLNLHFLAKNAV